MPSVAVVTTPFAFKVRAEVKVLKMPSLPILILPHPIGQISDDAMRRIADESYEEVRFALTSDADSVAAAYEDAVQPRMQYAR